MPTYKLEPDEDLMQFAARCGVSVGDVWNHPNNVRLVKRFDSPWHVGPGEEVFVQEKRGAGRSALSGKLQEFRKKPMPDIAEVHLGFMDEEVNARLAKLIEIEANKGDKARPVILIERGRLNADSLILEWRLGNYQIAGKDTPIRNIVHVSPQDPITILPGGKSDKANILDTENDLAPESILSRVIGIYMEQVAQDDIALKNKEIIVCRVCGLSRSALDDVCGKCGVSVSSVKCNVCGISKSMWLFEGQGCTAGKPHVWQDTAACTDDAGHNWQKPQGYNQKKECSLSDAIGKRHQWTSQKGVEFRRAFDLMELIRHRSPGPPSKSKLPRSADAGSGPWLSIVRFDVGPEKIEAAKDIRAPVIVIRTPEMGLQPSLMRPYIEFLFKSISLMASQLAAEKAKKQGLIDMEATKITGLPWDMWEWPLRVFQFGAQGSCSFQESYSPGKIITVIASLFVGVDIDKNGDSWSVISLCTPGGLYDFVRHRIKTYKDLTDLLKNYTGQDWDKGEWKDEAIHELVEEKWREKEASQETGDRQKREKAIDQQYEEKWQRLLSRILKVYRWGLRRSEKTPLEPADRIAAAQDVAAWIFQTQADEKYWGKLILQKANIHQDPNNPYLNLESEIEENTTLKDAIDHIYNTYEDRYSSGKAPGVVTLTVSYFGGEEDKDAADKLKIYSVGMEDFHVLRVLRNAFCQGISETTDYPIVLGWRIDRVQCDPKKIDASVLSEFNDYIRRINESQGPSSLLTPEEYADIIVWGLKGLMTTAMPKCAQWNFTDHYWKQGEDWQKLLLQHFWSYTYTGIEGNFIVPNPFYIEIATDLLKELLEMRPGIVGIEDEKTRTDIIELAKSVLATWKDEEKRRGGFAEKKGGVRQEQPLRVEERIYYGPEGVGTRAKAAELMEYIAEHCGFDSGKKRDGKRLLKTWLRPGKWGLPTNPVKEATTQDLTDRSDPKFDGACVDRAFYKSCNMMALQTMAGNLWGANVPMEPL